MPLLRVSRTTTLRKCCQLFSSQMVPSNILNSCSWLLCQTTPTIRTSIHSWRIKSTVTVQWSPSSLLTEQSRKTTTGSFWILSVKWTLNLAVTFGECLLDQRFQSKLCLLELMSVTRANRVLLDSVLPTIPICASIMLKPVLNQSKVRKLSHQPSSLTTSREHSRATVTSTMELCLDMFSSTEMESVTQWENKSLTRSWPNLTRLWLWSTIWILKTKSQRKKPQTSP